MRILYATLLLASFAFAQELPHPEVKTCSCRITSQEDEMHVVHYYVRAVKNYEDGTTALLLISVRTNRRQAFIDCADFMDKIEASQRKEVKRASRQ